MATSGTYTFSINRDGLLKAALRKAGAIAGGETPEAQIITDASESLNILIKHWQGTGIHIWRTTEATLFLQSDQVQYTLGTGATDHATESFTETALSAVAADAASTITVDSITGISDADYIGIQVDDGTFHWTTVNGSPSGSTITLTDALDDSASIDAIVIAYTTKLVRPLRIMSARRYNFASDLETPMDIEDRETYFDLPNKTSSGVPNLLFYDRRGGANATGRLYVWQPQSTPTDAIKFTFARPIQDFSSAANTQDLPEEWMKTIISNLALSMAPEYDLPLERYQMLQIEAARDLTEVQNWERELETIQFMPGR